MRSALLQQLTSYGARSDDIIILGPQEDPSQIRYLELRNHRGDETLRPSAVVEFMARPLMYALEGPCEPLALGKLRRILALRGDADYMALVEPGRLTIYGIALDSVPTPPALYHVEQGDSRAATIIPELELTPPTLTSAADSRGIQLLLFKLLDATIDNLHEQGVGVDDALSLAGRALFLRFLIDRRVVGDANLPDVCSGAKRYEDCFATSENASRTCAWLDQTFNGNLLPLSCPKERPSKEWFDTLGTKSKKRVFYELSNILYRTNAQGQLSLDWATLDFGHVPVGLLSQVYERHVHRYDPLARAESVHYTPRNLVEYMVDEVFCGIRDAHRVRVLDPAAGAGVFLIAALRRLICERWKSENKRPNTDVIRSILYGQLAGFDISETALRLAALSLYLTALELDPDPSPLDKLKFNDLRGTVLFDVKKGGEQAQFGRSLPTLGSLGTAVSVEHNNRYDIVIGNPPWTTWTKKAPPGCEKEDFDSAFNDRINEVESVCKSIAVDRLGPEVNDTFVAMPDLVPDLAFCWRAMQWARPNGRIALALHGRLLFKQIGIGKQARDDLFRSVRITGILNGSALRQTEVWPSVSAQFCLVFAENRLPTKGDAFYFVSPQLEYSLNQRGRLRIDSHAAEPVSWLQSIERPYLLKTLFRGTKLDVSIVGKFRELETSTLAVRQGYRIGSARNSAAELQGLRDLQNRVEHPFLIEPNILPYFEHGFIERPRKRKIYRAPLVLIHKTLPRDRNRGQAQICFEDIAYNELFYGISCADSKEPELEARYLLLVLNSLLPIYYSLMTSSQFGVERDSLLLIDISQFPIRPFDELSSALKQQIRPLSDLLIKNRVDWAKVDQWAACVYGLNRFDQETILDTLEVALPFSKQQTAGQARPTQTQVERYCTRLANELRPFAGEHQLVAQVVKGDAKSPWIFIRIDCRAEGKPLNISADLSQFIQEADELGASQIFMRDHRPGSLLVGTLAQYRYWTPSRARLCALSILHDHPEILSDSGD